MLTACAVAFLDLGGWIPGGAIRRLAAVQFVPSLTRFLAHPGWAAAGFVLVLASALIAGRAYCSAICPLGVVQDLIYRIRQRVRPFRLRHVPASNRLRPAAVLLGALALISGTGWLVGLMDPWSIFGRAMSGIVRPALDHGAVAARVVGGGLGLDLPSPVSPRGWHPVPLAVAALGLGLVTALAWARGRLFCNTLCPVGALLGWVGRRPGIRIRIDADRCVACSKCARACRAQCIDSDRHEVDASRCTLCFDCLETCPKDAIAWSLPPPREPLEVGPASPGIAAAPDAGRRALLALVLLPALAPLLEAGPAKPRTGEGARHRGHSASMDRHGPIAPPGAGSIERLNRLCTACQLCVAACPTGVIAPSTTEYGWGGVLQPHLDFDRAHCRHGCTRCGEVCPTGALQPLERAVKKRTAIGLARFDHHRCVIFTGDRECGECAGRCPTGAVQMRTGHRGLELPVIDRDLCVGCGACEHVCPATPSKAIVIEPLPVHRLSKAGAE